MAERRHVRPARVLATHALAAIALARAAGENLPTSINVVPAATSEPVPDQVLSVLLVTTNPPTFLVAASMSGQGGDPLHAAILTCASAALQARHQLHRRRAPRHAAVRDERDALTLRQGSVAVLRQGTLP